MLRAANAAGVTHAFVSGANTPRRKIADILLGDTIGVATEKPCAFLALRPPRLLARAVNLFLGQRYSTILELCNQVPSLTRLERNQGLWQEPFSSTE